MFELFRHFRPSISCKYNYVIMYQPVASIPHEAWASTYNCNNLPRLATTDIQTSMVTTGIRNLSLISSKLLYIVTPHTEYLMSQFLILLWTPLPQRKPCFNNSKMMMIYIDMIMSVERETKELRDFLLRRHQLRPRRLNQQIVLLYQKIFKYNNEYTYFECKKPCHTVLNYSETASVTPNLATRRRAYKALFKKMVLAAPLINAGEGKAESCPAEA